MAVSDALRVLRKGQVYRYRQYAKNSISRSFQYDEVWPSGTVEIRKDAVPGETVLDVRNLTVLQIHKNDTVAEFLSGTQRGNPLHCRHRREMVRHRTDYGLDRTGEGFRRKDTLCGEDISNASIRKRSQTGMAIFRRIGTSTVWCSAIHWNKIWCRRNIREPRFQNHGFYPFWRSAQVRGKTD